MIEETDRRKMIEEATALRRLAAVIDRFEAMTQFTIPVDKVDVQWSYGASCVGYPELREAISVLVSRDFVAFRSEALNTALMAVSLARLELAQIQQRNAGLHNDNN